MISALQKCLKFIMRFFVSRDLSSLWLIDDAEWTSTTFL